ncbi:MAG: sigma-70 family RNA polymerase sigma factor [Acidobacteria bacterium]|nr:sigma-70 family RNA polymerase sigma factor [Acidobacteriota bacterium]
MSTTPPGSRVRKPRGLTPGQFARLLASLADDCEADRETAAELYEEIRRALITFFEFHPTGFHPADEADEVFNRVARRLDEGREIYAAHPRHYFYAVARNLWRERRRHPVSEVALESEALPSRYSPRTPLEILEAADQERQQERRLRCLEECLQRLTPAERELIVAYYHGSGGDKIRQRQVLAARYGTTVANLRVRTSRLRDKLEDCVTRCLKRGR